jgi:D-alanyl-lipoteichoic acid acyltransferase DltB (MBOAT superfamily)
MLFNSLIFLFFFPVTALIYFLLPNLRLRNLFLLFASYYFYMNWNPRYAILIAAVTGITYTSSLLLEKWSSAGRRKAVAAICIVLILLVLFTYKYLGFAADVISGVLRSSGLAVKIPEFSILLPVGISFFSFQSIGYLVDVYRRTIPAERDFFTYALFISFFPQLVAGPIERASNLLPQFKIMHPFSPDQVLEGIRMMLWGYFLKLCVAERIAPYVDAVFNNYLFHNGNSLALGTFFFTFQIYGDFCGYSLIACGTSRCLGFRLMQNFAHPYFAESIRDFWRRWHISLSTWFMDYLYIPLGGNRCSTPRHIFNLIVTFLVSGIWHGANWTFVFWGLLHGVLVSGHTLYRKYLPEIRIWYPLHKLLAVSLTFVCVSLCWIFFRAESISAGFAIIRKIFTERGQLFNGDGLPNQLLGICCIMIMLSVEIKRELNLKFRLLHSDNPAVCSLSMALLIALILLSAAFHSGQFIYFQF